MDKGIAEELIRLVRQLDGPLNAATEATKRISDLDEQKAVRRAIAEIMLKVDDLLRPIVRQHPDLDPDK
jgi:hypothetical protein